jgi:hypothetical protein
MRRQASGTSPRTPDRACHCAAASEHRPCRQSRRDQRWCRATEPAVRPRALHTLIAGARAQTRATNDRDHPCAVRRARFSCPAPDHRHVLPIRASDCPALRNGSPRPAAKILTPDDGCTVRWRVVFSASPITGSDKAHRWRLSAADAARKLSGVARNAWSVATSWPPSRNCRHDITIFNREPAPLLLSCPDRADDARSHEDQATSGRVHNSGPAGYVGKTALRC